MCLNAVVLFLLIGVSCMVCGFFVKGHLNPPCRIGVAVFILSESFCRQMRRWFVTLWESCLSCVWICSDSIDYCCLTLLILACVCFFSPRCLSSLLEGFLPKVCLSSVLSLFMFCCGLPDLSHWVHGCLRRTYRNGERYIIYIIHRDGWYIQ